MNLKRLWPRFGAAVVATGILISFVVAVLPHHGAGYHMAFSLFLIGIVPYLVYGTLSPYLIGATRGVVGGFVLLIDLVTRLAKRLGEDPLAAVSTYWLAPLAMTAVVIAMTLFMGCAPDRNEPLLGGRGRAGTSGCDGE
jgi:hypothetical protein